RSEANVDIVSFLSGGGKLHVLIVDDEPPTAKHVAVELHVGHHYGRATVLALTAPSPSATTGIRLGGRAVESDGRWSAPARLADHPNRAGVIPLDVSPSSAMLVTLAP